MSKLTKEWSSSPKRLAVPIMTHPGIEILGKRVVDAVVDGEIHFYAIKLLAERYPSTACTVIMDLTVEAEAFGCKLSMPENEVPSVIGRLVYDEKSIDLLRIPDLSQGRIPEFIKANKLSAHAIDKPVLSGCIGTFSLAGRLFDMSELMTSIYLDPELIHQLLRKCTDFIIQYATALKQTGTAGIIVAEPAAGLLSNEDCLIISTKYIKELVEVLQDDDFAVVLHNCGNTGHCTSAMLDSGADVLHFGNKIDIVNVLKTMPLQTVIMGNLDPVGIFRHISPADVLECTFSLLRQTDSFSNFVLSTGCDVPPNVPLENIDAFYEALEKYNKN